MRRLFPLVLLALALAVGAYLVFSSPDQVATPVGSDAEGAPADTAPAPGDVLIVDRSSRSEVAGGEAELLTLGGGDEEGGFDLPRRESDLVVRGRVVDANGAPVAGASVLVRSRVSFSALFDRGGRRGPPGPPPPGDRRQMAELFRAQPLSDSPVRTDGGGVFEIRGVTFQDASVTVAVEHEAFAATDVQKDWSETEGALDVGEVVLEIGGTVRGRVVEKDATGTFGVANATVAFDRRQGGGFGRFGPPGSDDDAEKMSVQTDASGFFELRHVPSGRGGVEIDAERFEIQTARVEVENGGEADVGEVVLAKAVLVRGRVLDEAGKPVAQARVRIGPSEVEVEGEDEQNQRGRFGRGRGRGGPDFRNLDATTDENGEFAIDHVPASAPFRIDVTHRRYLDGVLDPVPAGGVGGEVTIQVDSRLVLRGQVVDAGTGQPIEVFGITGRPSRLRNMRERMARFGNRDGGRGGPPGMGDFGNELERQQELLASRLGGAGEIPGPTPEPTSHPDGMFELDDLEDGFLVCDVDAPGYVKVAAGPFELVRGAAAPEVVIRLERGVVLSGTVRDAVSSEPVVGASVELRLPDPEEQGAPADEGNPIARMRQMFRRGMVLARTQTDANGDFELPSQRPGEFVVQVTKRGFADLEIADQKLPAGRDTDIDVAMTRGATVRGQVFGLEPGQKARVVFSKAEGFGRLVAEVRDDSTYELGEIDPGAWFVRVDIVGEDGGRGRFGRDMLRRLADAEADLVVPELGGELVYDVDVQTTTQSGTLEGRVYVQGVAAERLRVEMSPVTGAVADLAEQAGRGAARRIRGALNADVQEDGTFTIREIPPGLWRVEVVTRGRGRGSLAAQEIDVRAGTVSPIAFDVAVTKLSLVLRVPSGTDAPRGARLRLVPAAEAAGRDPSTWNELPTTDRRVRGTTAEFDDLATGEWAYEVRAQGFATVTGTMFLPPGGTELVVDLQPAANGGGN
jgi:hypothetical protein